MNEYSPREIGAYNTRALNEPTGRKSELSNTIILYSTASKICRVEDLFPQPEDVGIFHIVSKSNTSLGDFLRSIGLNSEPYAHALDIEYVYNHSGEKLLSHLIKKLVKKNEVNVSGEYPITQLDFSRICDIMSIRFSTKWERLYRTVTEDFNPLQPLQIETNEDIKDTLSSQRNNTNSSESSYENSNNSNGSAATDSKKSSTYENYQSKSGQNASNGTQTNNYNNTQNEKGTSSEDGTEKNNTFGFNGSMGEDGDPRSKVITDKKNEFSTGTTSKGDTSQTDERVDVYAGTTNGRGSNSETDNSSKTTTNEDKGKGTSSQNDEKLEVYVRDNPINRKVTRTGNIGNITLQELTNQQREMLQWQFWDVVFQDCDTVLTRGMW